MKRSLSLPHIPCREPPQKRVCPSPEFTLSKSPKSLLLLSDDVLIQIFRHVLQSEVINTASASRLPTAVAFASTCRRLRHLFFTSMRTIDGTMEHVSHDLPYRYHNSSCTTCPSVIAVPLYLLLIQRSAMSLRVLKLPSLGVDTTALVLSMAAESCLQLRELQFTDRGAMNDALAHSVLSLCTLTRLTICEPTTQFLSAMPGSAALTQLTLESVSPDCAPYLTMFLRRGGRYLHSLTLAFYNERRFLPEPFAFPRFNLHRVYPDVHLDISKGVVTVLSYITRNRATRLPLLQELMLTTVGVDLNQESCNLINCPPPVKGLDTLTGTVQLLRCAMYDSEDMPHPLRKIALRTDHPLLKASLVALKDLLTPRVHFTLHVNDLTMAIPPAIPDIKSQTMTEVTTTTAKRGSTGGDVNKGEIVLLQHSITAARLESLLLCDTPLFKYSDFSQLRTLDISSSHFCLQYGRNVDAYRPRLVTLLKTAEKSLTTLRLSSYLKGPPESTIGKAFITDVLCHAPFVTTLELSDQFLITAFYRDNLTDLFLLMRNFHSIRFGSLKWAYNSIGHVTRAMTEFFQILPDFIRFVAKSCPLLKSLVLLSLYPEERTAQFRGCQPLRDAFRALDTLEQAIPNVNTCTVRQQLRLWCLKGRPLR